MGGWPPPLPFSSAHEARLLTLNGGAAVLSDLVKLSDCTVLQCNEYLNALMKLGDVLRRKHRNVRSRCSCACLQP